MYIEPWVFSLILAPIAAVSAIYIGYLTLLACWRLLSLTIGLASVWPVMACMPL